MNSDIRNILIGAGLAIISGVASNFIIDYIKSRHDRKALLVSISDELKEIEKVIANQNEVWGKTNTLIKSYMVELRSSTSIFASERKRLYLIKDSVLRNEIISFYHDLNSLINENFNRIGSVSKKKEVIDEQQKIVDKFNDLAKKSSDIRKKLGQ